MARSRLAPDRRLAVAFLPLGLLLAGLAAAGALSPLPAAAALSLLAGGCWWLREALEPVPAAAPAVAPPAAAVEGAAALPSAVLEGLPDAVVVVDDQRRIVAANALAREALALAAPGRDLALALRHPDVLRAADAALADGGVLREEIRLPQSGGQAVTLHAAGVAIGDGRRACVLVLRDETRARRAERSHADFVANASHELRSPLSALIGFIETLRGPASDDAAARDRFLSLMHGEAMRMARLIDDLLSLARVEIDEHVPPRGSVHLSDLLATTAETLAARATAREMTIAVDCPGDLPAVTGDDDQLTQVLHNLLDNAVKYGRPGSTVRISACRVERHPEAGVAGVVVSVENDGEAIAPQHLPRLTERFYRVDDGRSRRLGGTGLGLAIVKHIVNRHRGRLAIASEPGRGTTVTVFLPAAAAAADPAQP